MSRSIFERTGVHARPAELWTRFGAAGPGPLKWVSERDCAVAALRAVAAPADAIVADAALSGSELAAVRPLEAIIFEAMLPEAMPLEARLPEAIVAEVAADEAADNAELLDAAIVAAAGGVLSAWIPSEVAPSALVAVEIADEAVDDIGVLETAMVAAGVLRARVTVGDLGLSSLAGVCPTSVAAEVERPLRTSLGASVRTGGVREGGVLGDGAFCVPDAAGLWPFRLFAIPHLPRLPRPIAALASR